MLLAPRIQSFIEWSTSRHFGRTPNLLSVESRREIGRASKESRRRHWTSVKTRWCLFTLLLERIHIGKARRVAWHLIEAWRRGCATSDRRSELMEIRLAVLLGYVHLLQCRMARHAPRRLLLLLLLLYLLALG